MVEIELGASELPTAVLTTILVPRIDVEPAEADVSPWNAIVTLQQDHPRNPDGAVHEPDRVLLGRQVRPALEVERPIVLVDRSRNPLVQQRQCAANDGDVDRQVRAVEDEDLAVQNRHSRAAGTLHTG